MVSKALRTEEPWEKHLPSAKEKTYSAHGLEFTITSDKKLAHGPGQGKAYFTKLEAEILKQAAGGGKLPRSLSVALHDVKSILGCEIVDCTIDAAYRNR